MAPPLAVPQAASSTAAARSAPAAELVVLDGDARPMIDRAAQPHVAGLAHDDDAALATALGHRGDAGQGAQGVIISPAQRLGSLGEQRGEDDPPDTRQGSQDRHVALLGRLPRRFVLMVFGQLAHRLSSWRCASRICRFTSLRRSATARMWAAAASAVPAATVSAGWRKVRNTSAAVIRRMRCALRT